MQEMLSQAKYIGGIVGLCSNKTNKADNLQVSNCVSSPQYLQEDMEELLQQMKSFWKSSMASMWAALQDIMKQ